MPNEAEPNQGSEIDAGRVCGVQPVHVQQGCGSTRLGVTGLSSEFEIALTIARLHELHGIDGTTLDGTYSCSQIILGHSV